MKRKSITKKNNLHKKILNTLNSEVSPKSLLLPVMIIVGFLVLYAGANFAYGYFSQTAEINRIAQESGNRAPKPPTPTNKPQFTKKMTMSPTQCRHTCNEFWTGEQVSFDAKIRQAGRCRATCQ